MQAKQQMILIWFHLTESNVLCSKIKLRGSRPNLSKRCPTSKRHQNKGTTIGSVVKWSPCSALYSNDPILNPTKAYSFSVKFVLAKEQK